MAVEARFASGRRWGVGPFMALDGGTNVTIQGGVSVFDSSLWAERGLCSVCGSRLFYRLKATQQHIVAAGIFGEQEKFVFDHQVFIGEKPNSTVFRLKPRIWRGSNFLRCSQATGGNLLSTALRHGEAAPKTGNEQWSEVEAEKAGEEARAGLRAPQAHVPDCLTADAIGEAEGGLLPFGEVAGSEVVEKLMGPEPAQIHALAADGTNYMGSIAEENDSVLIERVGEAAVDAEERGFAIRCSQIGVAGSLGDSSTQLLASCLGTWRLLADYPTPQASGQRERLYQAVRAEVNGGSCAGGRLVLEVAHEIGVGVGCGAPVDAKECADATVGTITG